MIKFENTEVMGWEHAIRGMRNPMNSWEKSDSGYGCHLTKGRDQIDWTRHEEGEECRCVNCDWCSPLCEDDFDPEYSKHVREFIIGPNDLDLMKRLRNAGTDHRKFMRMITVYVDITGPLYWWKEMDTYQVGVVKNSCSTMHKIAAKEFGWEDFSHEHLLNYGGKVSSEYDFTNEDAEYSHARLFKCIIDSLNGARERYLDYSGRGPEYATRAKDAWWQMIQLLPSSYNQRRTVMLNYEVLANIYKSRRNHKLDEWHTFCDWIEGLPYAELIVGERSDGTGKNIDRGHRADIPIIDDAANIPEENLPTACNLCKANSYGEATEEYCKQCQFYRYSKYAKEETPKEEWPSTPEEMSKALEEWDRVIDMIQHPEKRDESYPWEPFKSNGEEQ